jgi:Lar family restriction alleviation protein
MMSGELKPCPFCGGAPVLDGKSESCRVRCLDCGTEGHPVFFDSDQDEYIKFEQEAMAAWNRRTQL